MGFIFCVSSVEWITKLVSVLVKFWSLLYSHIYQWLVNKIEKENMEMTNFTRIFLVGLVSLVLVACGSKDDTGGGSSSSGYSGKTSAATVSDSNKDDVVVASSIGAEKAIESSSAPKSLSRSSRDIIESLLNRSSAEITTKHHLRMQSRAVYDLSASVCNNGGSAKYTYDENNTSGYGSFTITYNNCSYSYGGVVSTVDGSAVWTTNEDGSFSYQYDLTTTYGSETYTVTATYECDAQFNCSYSDDFSYSGVSYKVSDVSVSGNSTFGFDVSAKVYHEDYGYIIIEAVDLISCADGGFSSGSIAVTDSTNNEVLSIVFVSCSEMTVTYNGVASTVAQ